MGMKVNGTTGLTFPDTTTLGSAGQSSVQAWVNFNGTGTVAIRANFNVSSITDNGVGDYTVNFANAMVDDNYAVGLATLSVNENQTTQAVLVKGILNTGATNKTASALQILVGATSVVEKSDSADVSVSIFR